MISLYVRVLSAIIWVTSVRHSRTHRAPLSTAFLIRNRRAGDISLFGMKSEQNPHLANAISAMEESYKIQGL